MALVGCGASTPSPQQIDARVRAQREALVQAPAPEATPAATAPKPPPRDPSVRSARAQAALPRGRAANLHDAGSTTPYVLATSSLGADGVGRPATMLGLVDVRADPGVLLGRHDFAFGPVQVGKVAVLETATGDPVVLAELSGPREASMCGWWISPRGPRFLCAPKITGPSKYEVIEGLLVESWQTDFPPPSLSAPTRTGRMFRLSPSGRWSEIDSFRCLGRPLRDVAAETHRGGIRRWQRDSIRRFARVARHQSDAFEDERATNILRDAVAVDACDAEPWRLLGRLEYQAGRAERAVPALAAAVALDSREPAALVDLADALVALDPETPEGEEALATALELLARPASTRDLAQSATAPDELARGLYRSYLDQTEAVAARHVTTRRRVEGQLQALP